jgi:hypothetical protein
MATQLVKTIFLLFALCFTIASAKAQKLSKKEATQILNQGWDYAKSHDSIAFSKLYSLNDDNSMQHRRPKSVEEVYTYCKIIHTWLDTAITRNLKIKSIEMEEMNLEGTDAQYWIKAWFQYDKNYYKGFGFYIAYFNDAWYVRDCPSTSRLIQE